MSEWLITLASFRALTGEGGGAAVLGAAAGAPALALIGALAVACFVKAFSAVFLGDAAASPRRRAPGTRAARCAPRWRGSRSRAPRSASGPRARRASRPTRRTLSSSAGPERAPTRSPAGSGCFPLLLLAVLALGGVAVAAWTRSAARTITWDCGYAAASPRIQTSASSFAAPLVGLFRWAILPDERRPRVDGPFPSPGERFESHAPDPVLDRLLVPGLLRGRSFLGLARVIQAGRVQTYLLYIVVTLVLLLAWSSSW